MRNCLSLTGVTVIELIFTFSSVERVQLAEAAPIDEPDTLVVQEKLQEAEDDDGILARSLSFMEEVSQSIEVAVVPLATVPVCPKKLYVISQVASGGYFPVRVILILFPILPPAAVMEPPV